MDKLLTCCSPGQGPTRHRALTWPCHSLLVTSKPAGPMERASWLQAPTSQVTSVLGELWSARMPSSAAQGWASLGKAWAWCRAAMESLDLLLLLILALTRGFQSSPAAASSAVALQARRAGRRAAGWGFTPLQAAPGDAIPAPSPATTARDKANWTQLSSSQIGNDAASLRTGHLSGQVAAAEEKGALLLDRLKDAPGQSTAGR